MVLAVLTELLSDLSNDPGSDQIKQLYKVFQQDFESSELIIDGHKVKVVLEKSKVKGFESYPETFVHLITRKNSLGKRRFDKKRANRIHWVRKILENRNEPDIIYFEFQESNGAIHHYYWLRSEDFVVIMKKIAPNYIIVTAFAIDGKNERSYLEKKLRKYQTGK